MPVPGPRTQQRPLPGYTNPALRQRPQAPGSSHMESYRWTPRSIVGIEIPGRRFNHWYRPAPVADMGQSPGLMYVTLRGNVLGAGIVRHFWRQTINYMAAQGEYSQAASAHAGSPHKPIGITRALRYMTRCVSPTTGTDNTRFPGLHTKIIPKVRSPEVTMGRGQVRSRPTVRNRISSFGSRVPPINKTIPAANE